MCGSAPGLSWVEARPLLNTLHLPAQALPQRSVCTNGVGRDSEPGVSSILFCLFFKFYWSIDAFGFPGGASGKEPACQCRTPETQVRSPGREDLLEESMATHSSILAWRTPRTEEPGGLQSMGPQRVGHD